MIRMILRHPAEWNRPQELMIAENEVRHWIAFAQRYRFAIELETVGP